MVDELGPTTFRTATIVDTLCNTREFRVFIPDITLQEAMKNQAHVMRVLLPEDAQFLKVLQIEDPLAGISAVGNQAQTAYAFLVDPGKKATLRFYLTIVFPHMPFPWHNSGVFRGDADRVVTCTPLGTTTHSGVPVLHVGTQVPAKYYEEFEEAVKERGYVLVDMKPYTKSAALVELYRANVPKVQDEVEKQVRARIKNVEEAPGERPTDRAEPSTKEGG